MKNKSNSIQGAWEKFFRESAVEDLDSLRAEGWKTIKEISQDTNRPISTIHHLIRSSKKFELKTIKGPSHSGDIRKITVARPKVQG